MEVLLQPHDSEKGNRRHTSNIPRHCAGLALANLALVVEPIPSDISQNGNDPLSNVIMNTQELYRETTQSVFKSYCTESLEPQASMEVEYDLRDSYSQLFQPDLLTQSYRTAPSKLDNSCLEPLASAIHAPIGNWAANYLALNSAQFAAQQHTVHGVQMDYKTAYVIKAMLPPIGTEKAKCCVNLSMVTLPNDGHKITSPVAVNPFNEQCVVHMQQMVQAHLPIFLSSPWILPEKGCYNFLLFHNLLLLVFSRRIHVLFGMCRYDYISLLLIVNPFHFCVFVL